MYKKYNIEIAQVNSNMENSSTNLLWNRIESEYQNFLEINSKKNKTVDKDLKIIRIFISSTFKDFYNERDVLVKTVFPKLRKWCEEQGLYLVECDLRWGVPSDATNLEAVSYCLDEIEKSREETNNHNFFLCLIGERFGWVPTEESLMDNLKRKYNYIEDSSVTLMEIVHGVLRSGTENSLFLIRSDNILSSLPRNHLQYFEESDLIMKYNVAEQKRFIEKHFSNLGCVKSYEIKYNKTTVDPVSGKERLMFSEFDNFSNLIEEYFKDKILNFKNTHNLSIGTQDQSEDMIHKSYLMYIIKNSLKRSSYIDIFKKQMINMENSDKTENPIIILTGEAGSGKSTIMSNFIEYLTQENVNIFYHFCGASSMSHSFTNVIKRLKSYMESTLNISFNDNDDNKELGLKEILLKQDLPKMVILIDAIDELWDTDIQNQIPKTTQKNIILIISCLCDTNSSSMYSKLVNDEYFLHQISVEKMERSQLIDIVSDYLKNFGKRLNTKQMDELMKFENAANPLWLLSACEELRIYGDYSTLTKHITTLPSTIADLNRMIIKRLTDQDQSNVLKTLLQLLVVSRAGLWESLVKDILAALLEFPQPISHSVWSDAVWQLKGFLQIHSIPLPLIKLRHRVMRESIEAELAMEDSFKITLHSKISLFLESRFDNVFDKGDDMFLNDYVYHLIKSNARNRLINFMRSKRSSVIIKQPYTRGRIMQSMRCINPKCEIPGQKKELMMCVFCANKMGELSPYGPNKSSCFYCGNPVFNDPNSKLYPCAHHRNSNPTLNNCCLCKSIFSGTQGEFVKCCSICKMNQSDRNCGIIIKEEDFLFNQQLSFSNAVYRIETLI